MQFLLHETTVFHIRRYCVTIIWNQYNFLKFFKKKEKKNQYFIKRPFCGELSIWLGIHGEKSEFLILNQELVMYDKGQQNGYVEFFKKGHNFRT